MFLLNRRACKRGCSLGESKAVKKGSDFQLSRFGLTIVYAASCK